MGGKAMANEVPVLLVRSDEDKIVAVSVEEAGAGWRPILGEAAAAVGGLLTQRRAGGSQTYARTFTMRPQDVAAWDKLLKHGKDGYTYATLWGDSGKITRQAMIKELPKQAAAQGAPSIDPVAMATLAATVQLQASIEKLHAAVVSIGEDVKEILEFLHMEQEADVLAALDTVHDVYLAYVETGEVGTVNWDRVAGMEHILKKQHRQVIGELDTIRVRMEFDSISKAKKSLKVEQVRVRRLMALEYHLLWALNEWTTLMLVAKTQRQELTASGAERAWTVVDGYREHARRAVQAVHKADGGTVHGRDWLDKIFTNGLVFGTMTDDSVRDDAIENRKRVRAATKDTKALSAVPAPKLILAA